MSRKSALRTEVLKGCSTFPRRLKPRCNRRICGGTEVPPFQDGCLFRASSKAYRDGAKGHFVLCVAGLLVAGCSALLLVGCSGGPSSSSVALQPLPPPQTQSVCATPATANPAGGGGIDSQIQIDPAVYGTADSSKWTVFGFSQEDPYLAGDSQVFAVLPDIVPRAWTHWDKDGRQASDYNFAYPSQARAHTITFIGGTTATALFPDEFPVAARPFRYPCMRFNVSL